VPETALWPQKRAGGVFGGAAKNSYVKSARLAGIKKAAVLAAF